MTEKTGQPSFSVIIPNHNGSRPLVEALDSIFSSGDASIEVIVVDDASTDDSQTITDQYPVRLVSHDTCLGAATARNTGAKAAGGEILVFTDTDIILPPDTFQILARDFTDPKTDAVIGLLPITRYGNLCSQYKNFYMYYTYHQLPDVVTVFYTSIASIRREIFLEAGGFDGTYRSATIEDMEFGVRLTGKGYRIMLDKELQVDHIRHYTPASLLKTGFVRASGMAKIDLRYCRDHREKGSYVTSSPSFLAGIALSFITLFFFIISLIFSDPVWLLPAGISYLAIILLNFGFLTGMSRATRPIFFIGGGGLILADLLFHGCGVCWGILSFFWRQEILNA